MPREHHRLTVGATMTTASSPVDAVSIVIRIIVLQRKPSSGVERERLVRRPFRGVRNVTRTS
jgi:hypothetical protein